MDYKVTDTQLKAIADKIREKAGIDDPGGKNLLKPGTNSVAAEPGKRYILSADITWDGKKTESFSGGYYNAGGTMMTMETDGHSPAPASGEQERIEHRFSTAPAGTVSLSVSLQPALNPTNVMIEEEAEGQTAASEYEAYYPRKLEFPDDFIDAIDSIETATET